jgi:hypothetical protein
MTPKELFNKITANGMREMDFDRFEQAIKENNSQFKNKVDELIEKLNERNSVYKAVIKEKKLTSYPLSIFYRDIQLTKDFISDLKTLKTE